MAKWIRVSWGFLRAQVSTVSHFRVNLLAWVLYRPLGLGIIYLLWSIVYSHTDKVGDFAFKDMLLYYLLVQVLGHVLIPVQKVNYEMWSEINEGKLDVYLARPVSYGHALFFRSLGEPFVEAAIGIPFFLVFALLLRLPLTLDPLILVAFVASVAGSLMIVFLIQFLIGSCTFWMERIFGLRDVVATLLMLFSGQLIPISVLPEWVAKISPYLPFQNIFFVPAQIYQSGDLRVASEFLLQEAAWVLGLSLAASAVWSRGLGRYASQGG